MKRRHRFKGWSLDESCKLRVPSARNRQFNGAVALVQGE